MDNKEKNFVSVLVCLNREDESSEVMSFFNKVESIIASKFEKYELVVVNNACQPSYIEELREWGKARSHPLTILHMSIQQDRENCMSAATDAAIGDFIFEFDSPFFPCEKEILTCAYEKALEGNDIVSICPIQQRLVSKFFYFVFNRNSLSAYPIRTDICRIVSRRAINRVQSACWNIPYRKAAYAASGLKSAVIEFPGKGTNRHPECFRRAVESVLLYTNAGYVFSMLVTVAMMMVTLVAMVYTIVVFYIGLPIEGWTTTMLVLTFGLTGLFGIMTIIIKYLSLILGLVFRKPQYLIENIEKIQK